jgi:hypothetical protein
VALKATGPAGSEAEPIAHLGRVSDKRFLNDGDPRLFPEFPLVFSQDHPRVRSGRNLGMRGGNTLKMGGAAKVIIVPCFHASRLRSQPSQQTHLGDESDT